MSSTELNEVGSAIAEALQSRYGNDFNVIICEDPTALPHTVAAALKLQEFFKHEVRFIDGYNKLQHGHKYVKALIKELREGDRIVIVGNSVSSYEFTKWTVESVRSVKNVRILGSFSILAQEKQPEEKPQKRKRRERHFKPGGSVITIEDINNFYYLRQHI